MARRRYHDVLGGYVPMHEPEGGPFSIGQFVRGVGSVCRVGDDTHHHIGGDRRPLPLCHHLEFSECAAMNVLHGNEVGAVVLSELEDADDVRVGELRDDARLALEHRQELRIVGQVREDALDHHDAFEICEATLTGEKDLRHPSRRETGDEVVLAKAAVGDVVAQSF